MSSDVVCIMQIRLRVDRGVAPAAEATRVRDCTILALALRGNHHPPTWASELAMAQLAAAVVVSHGDSLLGCLLCL